MNCTCMGTAIPRRGYLLVAPGRGVAATGGGKQRHEPRRGSMFFTTGNAKSTEHGTPMGFETFAQQEDLAEAHVAKFEPFAAAKDLYDMAGRSGPRGQRYGKAAVFAFRGTDIAVERRGHPRAFGTASPEPVVRVPLQHHAASEYSVKIKNIAHKARRPSYKEIKNDPVRVEKRIA